MSDAIAEDACREFGKISADRSTFESTWEDVATRVWPAYSGLFTGNGESRTPGEQRNQNIYDSTAPIALTRFASVMESMLTPRNQTWHRIVPSQRELMKDRSVRLWMEEANRLLFKYRYSTKANFSGQNYQNYLALGAFGTGVLFTDKLFNEPGLRYRAVHLGEAHFLENHQGLVDKVYRRFQLTARQAVQKWGLTGTLPKKILEAKGQNQEKKFWFLHRVAPQVDLDPRRLDFRGMAFSSHYFSQDDKTTITAGGFPTFPYSISRYVQAPGEVYGRSPAMEVLPAIKTLNEQKKTMLRAGHKALDPTLLTHDDGVVDTFSLRPGAINTGGVNAQGRALVHALPVGDLQAGDKMMNMEMVAINDAFLVTLFQILVENPQMTATEVIERTREKGMLLSPTMGRQQSEAQGPQIERELDLLSQQGLLPPLPPALIEAGGEFKVEYDSPLSRAQRAEEASGYMRWAETGLKFSLETQDPSAVDWINVDEAMPNLADIMAVPVSWVRSPDQVAAIRERRQKQIETQQAIDAAPAAASLAKNAQGGPRAASI